MHEFFFSNDSWGPIYRASLFIQPSLSGSKHFRMHCLTPGQSKHCPHDGHTGRFSLFLPIFSTIGLPFRGSSFDLSSNTTKRSTLLMLSFLVKNTYFFTASNLNYWTPDTYHQSKSNRLADLCILSQLWALICTYVVLGYKLDTSYHIYTYRLLNNFLYLQTLESALKNV